MRVGRVGIGGFGWNVSVLLLVTASAMAQKVPARAGAADNGQADAVKALLAESPTSVMETLIGRERESAIHRNMYVYVSSERSERTGGKLWTERVVECPAGHVRKLMAIDGVALNAEQEAVERGRLAQVLKDPAPFLKEQQDRMKDELHARQMVQLLDKAFLFDNMRQEGEDVRIDFVPDPKYQPQSIEERVLHGMSGTVTIDPRTVRLKQIEARLPQDVSIGFGILATVRAGTHFLSERGPVESGEWKTQVIDTHVDGRALFFKTLSKNEHAVHEQFERVANDLTLEQAVARAEQ